MKLFQSAFQIPGIELDQEVYSKNRCAILVLHGRIEVTRKCSEMCIREIRCFREHIHMPLSAQKQLPSVPVALLVRVSTVKQETDRQVSELREYAALKGYNIVEICTEQISGRADEAERHGLKRVEELAASGKVKKVLVHEVSRLARKNSVVHRFVESLEDHGVSLYWHAQGVETLLESGKRNPAASIMLALLAEIARNEVETLSTRIRSGLDEALRKGKKLGRPPGREDATDLLNRHRDIVRLLNGGQSIRHTSKITGKGISTVQRVKDRIQAA